MKDFGRREHNIKVNKPKESSKRNRLSKFILFLLFLIGTGLLIILIVNFLGYHSTRIATTTYGTLRDKIETEGLLIRNEKITFAPQEGKLQLYVSEGERVSAGTRIASLVGREEKDLYNYNSGLLSYQIDGLEMTLREESRANLTYDQFVNLRGKINKVRPEEEVNAGRPIFKIIDNFKFYLAVLLPQDEIMNYEEGSNVEVLFSELDERYFTGEIDQILFDQPDNIMIIKFNSLTSDLIGLRKAEVEIIREVYSGVVVPISALIEEEGTVGVMVSSYTNRYFKEVEVVGKVDEQVVIKGVGPGVEVILTN
ncbi:HlyD family efflux transporter periplasmic adaptor subunit [Natroniella sp. ANB-PHB2]|uniref:HlyD family efflux transporter periplasmic adaptor subunit n=1 Tax=Natroniella sp. ANB-PHB2 TaxID=3384444 RepID=UPI0038D3A57F